MGHIPGPWVGLEGEYVLAARKNDEGCFVVIANCIPGRDDENHMTVEEVEGNIALIAAAPELLEACKAAVDHCANCEDGLVDVYEYQGDPGHHEPCPCCSQSRAAIAKAEGVNP